MELSAHSPGPGSLLIAPPNVIDPNFFRAVVLLCEHSTSGSFGLILNRPIDVEIDIMSVDLAGYDGELCYGGPVQPDTLHFLHRLDIPDAEPVVEGVFWGGDYDALKELHAHQALTRDTLRLYLGYSGWGAGQLHDEIQAGGWIIAEADGAAVFEDSPKELWRKRLRGLGGEFAVLANFPIDPRLN
ncbi:MAG: YqgE/AlgH family protein [Rhodothermales bacterium]|nr:YqgE/AlgH family protein [Rhodothermales bacterium]